MVDTWFLCRFSSRMHSVIWYATRALPPRAATCALHMAITSARNPCMKPLSPPSWNDDVLLCHNPATVNGDEYKFLKQLNARGAVSKPHQNRIMNHNKNRDRRCRHQKSGNREDLPWKCNFEQTSRMRSLAVVSRPRTSETGWRVGN